MKSGFKEASDHIRCFNTDVLLAICFSWTSISPRFTENDLRISVRQLQMFLDEYPTEAPIKAGWLACSLPVEGTHPRDGYIPQGDLEVACPCHPKLAPLLQPWLRRVVVSKDSSCANAWHTGERAFPSAVSYHMPHMWPEILSIEHVSHVLLSLLLHVSIYSIGTV